MACISNRAMLSRTCAAFALSLGVLSGPSLPTSAAKASVRSESAPDSREPSRDPLASNAPLLLGALREPLVFAEIYDVDRLERGLRSSTCFELTRRFGAALREQGWLDQGSRARLEELLQQIAEVPSASNARAGVGTGSGWRSALLGRLRAEHPRFAPVVEQCLDGLQGAVWFALEPTSSGPLPIAAALGLELAPGAETRLAHILQGASIASPDRPWSIERVRADTGAWLDLWQIQVRPAEAEAPEVFLALRAGLAVVTTSRTLADRALAPRAAPDARLLAARERSLAEPGGELLWAYVGPAARDMALARAPSEELAWRGFLERFRGLSLGLCLDEKRWASRARFEWAGEEWHSQLTSGQALTPANFPVPADTLAVVALPRSLAHYARIGAACARLECFARETGGSAADWMRQVPRELAPLLEADAFEEGALLVVRPGSISLPAAYLALPMKKVASDCLAALESRPETPLGRWVAKCKEVEGATVVELADAAHAGVPRTRLALVRQEGHLIAAESAFQLRSYLRQRREPALAGSDAPRKWIGDVERQLSRLLAGAGAQTRPAALVHVRTEKLCEWGSKLALMLASFADGSQLDAFPTAQDIAHLAGDTSVVLLSEPGALELRGQGLLGGLLGLF